MAKTTASLVVIVDVVDQHRALIDAPDMVRGQLNFKRLTLTDITIDIPRVPKKKTLIDAMEKVKVKRKRKSNSWRRKLIVQKKLEVLKRLPCHRLYQVVVHVSFGH